MKLNKAALAAQLAAKPYVDTITLDGIEGEFCVRRVTLAQLEALDKATKAETEKENPDGHLAAFIMFNGLICDEEGEALFKNLKDFKSLTEPWLANKVVAKAMDLINAGPKAVETAEKN